MNKEMFLLGARDFAKGAMLAVITAVVTFLYGAISTGTLEVIDWNQVGNIALLSFVGYILKNYLSDADGKVFGRIG